MSFQTIKSVHRGKYALVSQSTEAQQAYQKEVAKFQEKISFPFLLQLIFFTLWHLTDGLFKVQNLDISAIDADFCTTYLKHWKVYYSDVVKFEFPAVLTDQEILKFNKLFLTLHALTFLLDLIIQNCDPTFQDILNEQYFKKYLELLVVICDKLQALGDYQYALCLTELSQLFVNGSPYRKCVMSLIEKTSYCVHCVKTSTNLEKVKKMLNSINEKEAEAAEAAEAACIGAAAHDETTDDNVGCPSFFFEDATAAD